MGNVCRNGSRKDKHAEPKVRKGNKFSNIRNVYNFRGDIGQGHFGAVRVAVKKGGNEKMKYAVKTIPKEKLHGDIQYLQNEIDILASLDHPNIIKFYETYEDDKYFHIVMEYCSGGELFDRIIEQKKLDEPYARSITKKIISAINHCHRCNVSHRDLKPENFLFQNSTEDAEVKIIDFGLSAKYSSDKKMDTILGTPSYVAPEVLEGSYSKECDMWSAGVVMYTMLCGFPPFYASSTAELFRKIKRTQYTFDYPQWRTVSPEAKDLISKLLCKDPAVRLNATQALEHRWFKVELELTDEKKRATTEILEALRSYHLEYKFAKEAMNVIVHMLLPDDKLKNLKEAFQYFDKDKTGMITYEELNQAMQESGLQIASSEIQKIIERVDYHGNGKINYTEFIAATVDRKRHLTKENLWLAFKHFDVDDSGFITEDNIREALKRAGRNASDAEIKAMIKEVDVTKNGCLSFEEFEKMFQGRVGQVQTRI